MPIPLKAGEVLRGRYRVARIIGQGGMGSIYLADDLRLEGRQCALKEVEHDRSLTPELMQEARDQFFREASVLARLDHPNLPKVSDYFSINSRDYLVMDFVPGKDLRSLVIEARQSNTFLNEKDVLNWANQLADALFFLHQQDPPIVHRDIKPSNLKVTPSGLLKLVDFGLVRVLAPGEITITILQGQGTALYTPLEQYGGDSVHTDVRSDIYSFGATLYNLLTNQAPANARDRFLNPELFISPRQVNSAISSRTEKAIIWAMSLHPDERPDTVEIFRQALLGDQPLIRRQFIKQSLSLTDILESSPERTLWWLALGLTLVSLVTTLFS
ncbi:MAG: serine/threonine protein kinase [Chloroflexi bacterium]|nr:serine/threonine-protein kinase [Anaerolineaceae bacterium]NMB89164.1 serine/threonine protein kinase [Chloroflexota bacterium]